jgi:hypothetical protein
MSAGHGADPDGCLRSDLGLSWMPVSGTCRPGLPHFIDHVVLHERGYEHEGTRHCVRLKWPVPVAIPRFICVPVRKIVGIIDVDGDGGTKCRCCYDVGRYKSHGSVESALGIGMCSAFICQEPSMTGPGSLWFV